MISIITDITFQVKEQDCLFHNSFLFYSIVPWLAYCYSFLFGINDTLKLSQYTVTPF